MAILSTLISLFARKIGDLLQAVFGWSITGLFGRLPSGKKTALSATLLLSVLWPLLVLGVFFPGVAAWAVAFLPLNKWMRPTALRVLWLVLAVCVPAIVGAITAWVAPSKNRQGGFGRTVVGGYPLTVGYAAAFFITLFTVPILKVAAMARGWADDHVYVQPKEGAYATVLDELTAACSAVGAEVARMSIPRSMSLASRVLKFFARGALQPVIAEDQKMLRGDKQLVARVRAAMTQTMLERFAYLVEEPDAQSLQDELQRMWDVLARHKDIHEIGGFARGRLREIQHDLERAPISFDEWAILDRSLSRIERAFVGGPRILKRAVASPHQATAIMKESA